MNTRVRFITRKWTPAVGGMETYCIRVSEELKRYCRLEVIALTGEEELRPPSFLKLLSFGIKTFVRLLFAPSVKVTHVGDMACWPFAWFSMIRGGSNIQVISAHGSDISFAEDCGFPNRLYAYYLYLGAWAVGNSTVIANSHWLAGLARKYGFNNTHVVPLGTDFNCKNISNDGFHSGSILFVGRIVRSKGLEFFVDEVLPRFNNASSVTIRVAGVIGDDSQHTLLEHPNVEYVGPLTPQRLYEEYAEALCVIVPSQRPEGFGLVAAEAACAGGVVVAAGHSGLEEVCANGVGILVRVDAPAEWYSAIENIRKWTTQQRMEHIARSASLARERYNWQEVGKKTYALYGIE